MNNTPRFRLIRSLVPLLAGLFLMSCAQPDQQTQAQTFARGINLSNTANTILAKEDIARWKTWGVNTVRIGLSKDDMADPYTNPPDATNIWLPYTASKARLQQWITWLGEYDIKAMVTLDLLWGDDHNSSAMWANGGNNIYLQHRIDLAGEMAAWLKNFSNVKYLEVWNEPHPYSTVYKDYFLPAVVQKIRAVNPDIEIVCMSPWDWGLLQGLANWNGLADTKVTYSTHIYSPWTYTHQNISGNPLDSEGWPGYHKDYPTSALSYYDIAWVRSQVDILTAFQARSGSKVMITEFGVLRWAIGNDQYLNDLITVFEENNLEWIFHGIGGWNGWNPTFASDAVESFDPHGGVETPALTVLKSYWGRSGS